MTKSTLCLRIRWLAARMSVTLHAFGREIVQSRSREFLKLMAVNAAAVDVPLGWLGRFKLEDRRMDCKRGGLMPIFSAAQAHQLLRELQDTEAVELALPLAQVSEWITRTPDAVAVTGAGQALTYGELDRRAGRLAARLKFDPAGRYALHVGVFTGSSFTSGWNSTGLGTGEATAEEQDTTTTTTAGFDEPHRPQLHFSPAGQSCAQMSHSLVAPPPSGFWMNTLPVSSPVRRPRPFCALPSSSVAAPSIRWSVMGSSFSRRARYSGRERPA